MGFATIVDMIVFVCVPAFGEQFIRLVLSARSRTVEMILMKLTGMGAVVD
jgi:hypothetical protein